MNYCILKSQQWNHHFKHVLLLFLSTHKLLFCVIANFVGVDPNSLRGTNAGVYIGCSGSEATQAFGNDPETLVGYSITGTNRTMLANRLSYILDFKG